MLKQLAATLCFALLATRGFAGEKFPTTGTPVDPVSTLVIDLPENMVDGARAAGTAPIAEVPGIVTGQRIALPRDAVTGDCRTDAVVSIVGGQPVPANELDPDGRHYLRHTLATAIQTTIDPISCEIVVDEATAIDHVRRSHFKHLLPPALRNQPLPSPVPSPASATGVNPRESYSGYIPDVLNRCILNRLRVAEERDTLASTNVRVRSRARQLYFDYPWAQGDWAGAFLIWYFAELQWVSGAYFLSPDSWIGTTLDANTISHTSSVKAIYIPADVGFTVRAQSLAHPGGYWRTICNGNEDTHTVPAGGTWHPWTHRCLTWAGVWDAFWVC